MRYLSLNQRILSSALKGTIIISVFIGIFMSAYAGKEAFMGGSRVFMYYTIQSNFLIGFICAIGLYLMRREKPLHTAFYVIKLVGTVAITLTGVVFAVFLAPIIGEDAWNAQNTVTHLVVPVLAVLDFILISPNAKVSKKNVFFVVIPPILYVIYAWIGYVSGWEFSDGKNYPYFFLNWGSPAGVFGVVKGLPYLGTGWWIMIMLLFMVLTGLFFLFIADVIYDRINSL